MRKIRYPKPRNARPYAGLIVTVCATIFLSGWTGCPDNKIPPPAPPPPRSSPITVVDGSMVIRTAATKVPKPNEPDISGGYACSISLNGATVASVKDKNWTITSFDSLARVSTISPSGTPSGGAIVFATGPDPKFSIPTSSMKARATNLDLNRWCFHPLSSYLSAWRIPRALTAGRTFAGSRSTMSSVGEPKGSGRWFPLSTIEAGKWKRQSGRAEVQTDCSGVSIGAAPNER